MQNKNLAEVAEFHGRMTQALGKVIVGQNEAIDHVIAAFFCNGHVLLSGGAATAKGLLVRAMAHAARLDFKRIQFTPDLMPSDITGSEVLEEDAQRGKRVTRFVPGPIFSNLLMADEINRTPPKTQAALLEGMQERQVTTGNQTRPLPKPFFVIATKTSVETDGTYPLPEAQQDRFMFNVEMRPLKEEEELRVVLEDPAANLDGLPQVFDAEKLAEYQRSVREVVVPPAVQQYIVNLTAASRPGTPDAIEEVNKYVAWGAGVRATQYLALGGKAQAAMHGRDQVTVADVQAVVQPVMRHRIGMNFRAENDGVTSGRIIEMLLAKVKA